MAPAADAGELTRRVAFDELPFATRLRAMPRRARMAAHAVLRKRGSQEQAMEAARHALLTRR
jgi:hypothetical protein